MDVSLGGAGHPISISGIDDDINLKRLSKDKWQDMIKMLQDEMKMLEVKLGDLGRRFADMIAADKTERNGVENVLKSSSEELVSNEKALRSLKAVLGLPIDG